MVLWFAVWGLCNNWFYYWLNSVLRLFKQGASAFRINQQLNSLSTIPLSEKGLCNMVEIEYL